MMKKLILLLAIGLMMVGVVSAGTINVNSAPNMLSAESIPWGENGYIGADFEAGRSDVITILTDMTLGELTSISFEQNVTIGYPASVNILLDVNGDGVFESKKNLTTGYLTAGVDDVLKIEWAHNPMSHYSRAPPYTEAGDYNNYFSVFKDVTSIGDTANAWLYSGMPGAPGDDAFNDGTLAEWKAGKTRGTNCYYVDNQWHTEVCDDITIDSNTKVYGIQIEVLGWIAASSAKVRNIQINGEPYYTSIQQAINDANPSDVINVTAGTYVEDLTITTANLELAGADKATTIIKGIVNVPVASYPLGDPNIDLQADGVKIHGFTIEGPDYESGYYASGIILDGTNIEVYDNNFVITTAESVSGSEMGEISHAITTISKVVEPTADVSGLHIYYNTFTCSGIIGCEAIYINPHTGIGTITIEDNQISGSVNIGITVESGSAVVDENTIETTLGYETAPYGTYGIRFFDSTYAGTYDNIVISNNDVQGFKRSVRVGNGLSGPNNDGTSTTSITATIQSNTLTSNNVGIWARQYGVTSITATSNLLSGNTVGIQNDGTISVNAEKNWWGTTTKSEINNLVSANVDFEPWCSDSTCGTSLTDVDGDGYTSDVDCNDNDANINPGATETINGKDDDCDAATDEASLISYSSTWASTVKAALDWLFNRAEQDTDGVNIYLHKGWNTFKMPWFVLTGTAQNIAVKDALAGNYSVTKVLASIDGNYNYLAYYDGASWQTYIPSDSAAITFTTFPTAATDADHDFHIYINATGGARLTIE